MVINFINNNKIKNQLSPETVENNTGSVTLIIGDHNPPSDHWIPTGNTNLNKQWKHVLVRQDLTYIITDRDKY